MMRIRAYALLFLMPFTTPLLAFENYFSNIFSPIPPACVTLNQIWDSFNLGGAQIVASGVIQLHTTLAEEHDVVATVWQKGCPESGRRVVMLTIEVADDGDDFPDLVITPVIWASGIPGDAERKKMRAVVEPNSFFASDELRLLPEGSSLTFFIDTVSFFAPIYEEKLVMSVPQYNGAWTMEIEDPGFTIWTASVPGYANHLRPARMTLTGRLSGNWVTPGAPDQGFVLAFNELSNDLVGLVFLSWYTYDQDGNLLWLTASQTYEIVGTREVTMDIQLVTNGVFLGSKVADRQVAGTVKLVAYDCNNLELTYNLNQIGLGSGTIPLRRVFSLEIQGYVCGDLTTRAEHVNDGS